jgi:hypothetical protein
LAREQERHAGKGDPESEACSNGEQDERYEVEDDHPGRCG